MLGPTPFLCHFEFIKYNCCINKLLPLPVLSTHSFSDLIQTPPSRWDRQTPSLLCTIFIFRLFPEKPIKKIAFFSSSSCSIVLRAFNILKRKCDFLLGFLIFFSPANQSSGVERFLWILFVTFTLIFFSSLSKWIYNGAYIFIFSFCLKFFVARNSIMICVIMALPWIRITCVKTWKSLL